MANNKKTFDHLLATGSRAELRSAVSSSRLTLSLPQAQRLIAHANGLEPTVQSLRLGIIHTYTSDLLDPWLSLAASLQGLDLQVYHAPYGLSLQEAQPESGLVRHKPDLTLLLLRREDLHPDLGKPLGMFNREQQKDLREEVFAALCDIVERFRAYPIGQIVVSLLPPIFAPGAGLYDVQSERSESHWWNVLKSDVGRYLRESMQASLFVDLDEVLLQLGRQNFFDLRFWYSARFPFSATAAREVSRRVVGLGAVLKHPRAKVIVLDADNTLWGGVIGEDGINGIALGPDYPGNAYVDFQRRILDYQQRGFILALCSKNNPADLDQVLQEHPHQLLRDEHFAARRVNWIPKPDNLVSLAEELNLGLDSFIFVDDSDYECAAVRHKLPQVEVVQTPNRPVDVPTCLEQVERLEVLSLTVEDLAKTQMYAHERQRRELRENLSESGGGLDDYLASLKMKVRLGFNDATQLKRLTQLTQKTNQFNLTTQRYDEQRMEECILADDWWVAHFSLTDIFGDSGVVGLALFYLPSPGQAELNTFLMSCRVIGRNAETAFLHALLRRLAEQGVARVVAEYLPTPKNALVANFLPEQGFEKRPDGRYERDLRRTPPIKESDLPIEIEVSD